MDEWSESKPAPPQACAGEKGHGTTSSRNKNKTSQRADELTWANGHQVHCYLTIIPRMRVGYELLDSGRGAEHRVGYDKLMSNKREWNNCFIKYQTLNKNISNFIFHELEFRPFLRENFPS